MQGGSSLGGSELGDDPLEPKQRTSQRGKPPVNYTLMATGTGELSASMDYGEVSGARAVQKKVVTTAPQMSPKDVRQKCEQVFQLLRCHPSVQLFLETLDPAHPKFNELQGEFINIHKIELCFRSGKYQSTFQLASDVRKMWLLAYKLFQDEPEKIQKTQEIQQYFDKIFADLENKQLTSAPLPPIVEHRVKKMKDLQKEMNSFKAKENAAAAAAANSKNQRTIN